MLSNRESFDEKLDKRSEKLSQLSKDRRANMKILINTFERVKNLAAAIYDDKVQLSRLACTGIERTVLLHLSTTVL